MIVLAAYDGQSKQWWLTGGQKLHHQGEFLHHYCVKASVPSQTLQGEGASTAGSSTGVV